MMKPTKADLRRANSLLMRVRREKERGLVFRKLEGKLEVIVFSDAAFQNLGDSGTQGGMMVMVCEAQNQTGPVRGDEFRDKEIRGAVLTWRSAKVRKVTTSTFAAETIQAVAALDAAAEMRNMLRESVRGQDGKGQAEEDIELHAKTDCKNLVDHVHSLRLFPRERRLRAEVAVIREFLQKGELTSLQHIPSHVNVADALTKTMPSLKGAVLKAMGGVVRVPVSRVGTVCAAGKGRRAGAGSLLKLTRVRA